MLVGETGEMVNEFRQLKLKEYYSVMNMCEEKGVTLSRALLDRGTFVCISFHFTLAGLIFSYTIFFFLLYTILLFLLKS